MKVIPAYLMKVIPAYLMKVILSVSDEGYSEHKCLGSIEPKDLNRIRLMSPMPGGGKPFLMIITFFSNWKFQ
jgi:hypothetical protein